jgi:hypothetical protein
VDVTAAASVASSSTISSTSSTSQSETSQSVPPLPALPTRAGTPPYGNDVIEGYDDLRADRMEVDRDDMASSSSAMAASQAVMPTPKVKKGKAKAL